MPDFKDISDFANSIRRHVLQMVYESKASHIGGAFSMADILAVLYSKILKVDSNNPKWDNRDRFLLSKGHAVTSLYATLALKGFFDIAELTTYGKDGSRLLSHASHKVPGVELSTGSLGHALSVGCGMAIAAQRGKRKWRVFVLLSDGELDEGSNWEAFLFAPQHQLDNLVVIIDYNKIQSLGAVKEVIDLSPLKDKFKAFNWSAIEINGHNHEEIYKALSTIPIEAGKPMVIIANTVKGKGVDFMENQLLWHYKSPSKEQVEQAMKQLEERL